MPKHHSFEPGSFLGTTQALIALLKTLWMSLASSPLSLDILSMAVAKSPAQLKAHHHLLVLVSMQ